jgi:hypothetical protein
MVPKMLFFRKNMRTNLEYLAFLILLCICNNRIMCTNDPEHHLAKHLLICEIGSEDVLHLLQ